MASEAEHPCICLLLNSTHHGSTVTSSLLILDINFQAYFVGWVSVRLVGFLGKVSVPAGAGTESFSCWESMHNPPMEGMYWLNGKQNPKLPPLQKHSRKTFPSCLWKICIRVKVMQEDLAIFLLTLKCTYKFKRSSCTMGWTMPDDDRDWGFALVGVSMVSGGLMTLVVGLSNLESGDWHSKVLALKNTDVTFVLWKIDTPIWWLVGFRLEIWKPSSNAGFQLAVSSVLGVLLVI